MVFVKQVTARALEIPIPQTHRTQSCPSKLWFWYVRFAQATPTRATVKIIGENRAKVVGVRFFLKLVCDNLTISVFLLKCFAQRNYGLYGNLKKL